MADFSVSELRTSTIAYVQRMRDSIELDPVYQRQGEVWSRAKQRLLIDSIINQFDIPKIYFHEHAVPIKIGDRMVKYSLVDGRQRLEAVWDFMSGKFALADDFVLLETGSEDAAGMTFSELQDQQPDIASLFAASPLDIMVIRTSDVELIEEMFSRLNEAVPLNAAEKRNGRGGPLRSEVRGLCESQFFLQKLPFTNRRYRHYDVATKFLYLIDSGMPADTKKQDLDDFWEEFRRGDRSPGDASQLAADTKEVLDSMMGTFEDSDPLLASVGMVSLYFLLFQQFLSARAPSPQRATLVAFNRARQLNRFNDEDDLSGNQRQLLEFDRLAQSPNDGGALRTRLSVISDFLKDPSQFQQMTAEPAR